MSQSATFSGATAKHNYTLVGYHFTEPSSPTYQTRNRETSPYQYNHVPAQTWTSRSPSPNIDASQQELKLVEVRERRSGWRGGLLLWLTLAVTVFACNAGSLIWVMSKAGTRNATPMLAESDCKKMKKTSQVVHLFINVLSTGLLHASQYVVQIATSPTRSDLDRAHSKTPRDWMNIGIPGMRNLRGKRIGRKRVVLCWILWLSSVPLHLL